MDKQSAIRESPGLYLSGIVISSIAKAFKRKDVSEITVKVEHEIALQPGTAVLEEYLDPASDSGVKLDEAGNVTTFPRLELFKHITLKVDRFREFQKRLFISGHQVVS